MKNRFFLLLLAAMPLQAASDLQVRLKEQKTDEGLQCRFEVKNNGQQAVIALAVGGNENMAGPYEFAAPPIGWESKDGEEVDPPNVPAGWDASSLAEEGVLNFAFEWQTKDSTVAVQPGKSFDGFVVVFRKTVTSCKGVHWTVITRDSQVVSGLLE